MRRFLEEMREQDTVYSEGKCSRPREQPVQEEETERETGSWTETEKFLYDGSSVEGREGREGHQGRAS